MTDTKEMTASEAYQMVRDALKAEETPYVEHEYWNGWNAAIRRCANIVKRLSALPALMPKPEQEMGLAIAQEPKYTTDGHALVNRASGEEIPEDEPVFILRARDIHAAEVISEYARVLNDKEHKAVVWERYNHFMDFKRQKPERMKEPDTAPPKPGTKTTGDLKVKGGEMPAPTGKSEAKTDASNGESMGYAKRDDTAARPSEISDNYVLIQQLEESLAYFCDEFPRGENDYNNRVWDAPIGHHCGGITPNDLQAILSLLYAKPKPVSVHRCIIAAAAVDKEPLNGYRSIVKAILDEAGVKYE